MFDTLWTHILRRLEAFPDATFRESELVWVSKQFFDQMIRDGFLEFDNYDKDGDSYFSDRMGDQRVERAIRVRNEKITAFSAESDVGTLELTKPETTYYRFKFDKLFQCLRKENNLSGSSNKISERIIFVGHFGSSGKKISVLFGLFYDERWIAGEILGIRSRIEKCEGVVVLCPTFKLSSQDLTNRLQKDKIVVASFFDCFDDQWKIKRDILSVLDEAAVCTMHLLGTVSESDRNNVKISGATVELSDAPFQLLVRLILGLKKSKDGWVSVQELISDGCFTEDSKYQSIGRFKKELKAYLSDDFIENKSKKYRLALPSENVTYDKKKFYIHPNTRIREIAKKLP